MYNIQHPKYFRRVCALLIIALFIAASQDDALEKCEERMSREVCLHTLYP